MSREITPHEEYPELGKALGISGPVFFKREDLHPYGSHKGRSIPLMIDKYIDEGFRHFAISSSGNAALAAGLHIQKINSNAEPKDLITLEILVGEKINPFKFKKLDALKSKNILVSVNKRPLQALTMKIQDSSIKSLRQSSDDLALEGYYPLAKELLLIPNLQAVFIGTSSGTTAEALVQYFEKNKKKIEVHIVQTTSCHPISDAFIQSETTDEISIADAIVDKTALRKNSLVLLLKKTGGSGRVANNEEIKSAQELAKKYARISISPNSALSLSGLMQATYTGKTWDGAIVCMICGD